jgi:hypothetical protein
MNKKEEKFKEFLKALNCNKYFLQYQKTGIPRCFICGEKFIQEKKYLWKGNCTHFPQHLRLAVG